MVDEKNLSIQLTTHAPTTNHLSTYPSIHPTTHHSFIHAPIHSPSIHSEFTQHLPRALLPTSPRGTDAPAWCVPLRTDTDTKTDAYKTHQGRRPSSAMEPNPHDCAEVGHHLRRGLLLSSLPAHTGTSYPLAFVCSRGNTIPLSGEPNPTCP